MSSDEPIFFLPGEDPAFLDAAKRAQESFRYFWREVAWEQRRIIPALGIAAVKAPFVDPPGTPTGGLLGRLLGKKSSEASDAEQMWVSGLTFDGRTLSGVLLNSPSWLKSVRRGQAVELPRERVTDWMYTIDGKVYGGFTVDVIRGKMSAQERATHDGAWGLDFGEVGTIDLTPGWGAADPDVEHPMSENMGPMLREALESDPPPFLRPGPKGLTTLHEMALAGSMASVELLLEFGSDPHLRNEAGLDAIQLAESMGWARVVARLRAA